MSASAQYKTFFDVLRGSSVFPKRVRASAVKAIHCIINECIDQGVIDFRQIAYVLATPRGEVGSAFLPVREGFSKSDAGAIKAVANLHRRGKISRNYALRHKKTGQSYYGRGWVQLTHFFNYEKYARLTGLPLTTQPDLMLTDKVSAFVLVHGMRTGGFTSKKLADYFGQKHTHWLNARRIVNSMDKADKFARFAKDFHKALKAAFPNGQIPKYEENDMQNTKQPSPLRRAPEPGQGGLLSKLTGGGLVGYLLARFSGGGGGAPEGNPALDACIAAIQSGQISSADFTALGVAGALAYFQLKSPLLGGLIRFLNKTKQA
ncbi:MAG: hypothetical protein OIF56_14865 [Cohaesibacter sp.]|nr:hypothetical protein [Cohaesibacter sp.]